jgi:hypothetical protein
MFKSNWRHILLSTLLLFFFDRVAMAETDVATLLKKADAFRLSGAELRVETEIRLFKSGKLDKKRRYTVFLKPGRRSLVLFRSPSELGQKLLMLDDQFWIMMPRSRRPIRITPTQKLLGEASSGDLATLTWSEDYKGVITGKAVVDDVPCLVLDLKAARTGVTYAGITLYLAEADHRPVKADLYVASGKLAKVARFKMGTLNGRRQVISMTLIDRIQIKRLTEVHYLAMRPQSLPDKVYNPAYLVRNDLTAW